MNLSEGVLIVVVIVLIAALVMQNKSGIGSWTCVDNGTGEMIQARVAGQGCGSNCSCASKAKTSAQGSPEKAAQSEQIEHFTVCAAGAAPPTLGLVSCEAGTDDNYAYANSSYGAPGADFKDWVMVNGGVDAAVVQNHSDFVKDRLNNGTWTGGQYAFDAHEGLEETPWIGIRGPPQRVPVCNPTQVQDTDESWYPAKQVLVWRTDGSNE